MANPRHLEILKQGVDVWNTWRKESPEIIPDLSYVGLNGADLRRADLSRAYLSHTHLNYVNLSYVQLNNVTLSGAELSRTNLSSASLSGAELSGASLFNADLSGANLNNANLGRADLSRADFNRADLTAADMTGARLSDCSFGYNDLSEVKGLETIFHGGPSTIGIDTIYKSHGKIPEVFLRGCGVPESFIVQIPALVAALEPIQFYSCFISYSSKDQEFAERLHADLQAKGVRVWFAPHDMPIGARLRPTIDESIRVYDKLLLVLSEASVSSQWVEQEVETALRKERQPGSGTVLFPVRLDDSVFEVGEGWPALIKDTRHVGDFTRWKEHDSYQRAFERLLRDLKAGA